MAARRFPATAEALLAGFVGVSLPAAEKLPAAAGFAVHCVGAYGSPGELWLALSRQPSGKQDLFAAMVANVVDALNTARAGDSKHLLQLFLSRVRAWQAFMRRGALPLGPEAEAGLVGELCFL